LSGCELPPVCGQFAGAAGDCVELNHPPKVQIDVGHAGIPPHLYAVPIVGNYVSLYAAGSDPDHDVLSYEWDLNADGRFETASDGTINGHPYVERIFGTPGVRRVTVRVTDFPGLGGGEGSATATVDVRIYTEQEAQSNQRPVASFTASVSGQTVRLDASGSSDPDGDQIVLYRWDFDDDSFFDLDVGEPTTTWTFDRAGKHDITLRVIDAAGFPSKRVTQTVTTSGPCSPPSCPGSPQGARSNAGKSKWKILPFAARIEGRSLRATLLDPPGAASWTERTLRRFLKAPLRPKLTENVDDGTASGIAVASGRRGSKACVRISVTIPASGLPTGRFEMIGGTGAASLLRATATFRFAGGPKGSALGLGNVRAARGKTRPLTVACRKLGRVRSGH